MANAWELHQVTLTRTSAFGLGMAVAGGVDSPYVPGETAIVISDVLRDGPAEGKLCVGDRLLSVNGVSLLDVSHAFAIKQLKLAGNTVDLVVHRRVKNSTRSGPVSNGHPASPRSNNTTTGVTDVLLARRGTWEELGMNLGCRLFISGVTEGSVAHREGLRAGDVIRAVNGISADHLSLLDAIHLMSKREEVRLGVERVPDGVLPEDRRTRDVPDGAFRGSSGNLLAAQPTLGGNRKELRPPPWKYNSPEGPRSVALRRDPTRSTGLRIIGGNAAGVFVASVEPNSPAEQAGLREGDRLLRIGRLETAGLTKEEAALELIGQDSVVNLVVTPAAADFSRFVATGESGDSLYIRVHFDYRGGVSGGSGGSVSSSSSLSGAAEAGFRRGQIFHVVDTMVAGVVGSWLAVRVHPPCAGGEQKEVIIPNENRASQLALTGGRALPPTRQPSSFLRRKRSKSAAPGTSRSSSDLPSSASSTSLAVWERAYFGPEGPAPDPFPPYERVVLRHPGFPRPVVLFGPLASEARVRLLRERPGMFAAVEPPKEGSPTRQVIKLSLIRSVMNSGRHALLDVTPGAVQRLNFAQLAPIVLFLRPEAKPVLKVLRAQCARYAGRAGKKLLEEAASLELMAGHLFTGLVPLRLAPGDNALCDWFSFLLEMVQHQQREPAWMPVDSGTGGSRRRPEEDCISVRQAPEAARTSAPNLLDQPDLQPLEGTLTRSVSDPHLLSPPKPPRAASAQDQGYVSDGRVPRASMGRTRGRAVSRWGLENSLGSGGLSQSSSALLGNQRGGYEDEVDPYAVHTLPGKRNLPPHTTLTAGDGYATVRKPAASARPEPHDAYRFVRSSAMAPAGQAKVPPPLPRATAASHNSVYNSTVPNGSVFNSTSPNVTTAPNNHVFNSSAPNPTSSFSATASHNSVFNATAHNSSLFNSTTTPHNSVFNSTTHLKRSPNLRPPASRGSPVSSDGPLLTDRQVLAEASGLFDDRGGQLEVRQHQVSLRIPPGALPPGAKQEVYFKIYKESGVSLPSLDAESGVSGHSSSGATLVSPLVMCGPHGLRFLRPVELRMPHRPDLRPDSWQFSLLHASSDCAQPARWRETRVGGGPESGSTRLPAGATPRVLDNGQISVLVDHF